MLSQEIKLAISSLADPARQPYDAAAGAAVFLSLLHIDHSDIHYASVIKLLRYLCMLEDAGQIDLLTHILDALDKVQAAGYIQPQHQLCLCMVHFRFGRLPADQYVPFALKFIEIFEFRGLVYLFPGESDLQGPHARAALTSLARAMMGGDLPLELPGYSVYNLLALGSLLQPQLTSQLATQLKQSLPPFRYPESLAADTPTALLLINALADKDTHSFPVLTPIANVPEKPKVGICISGQLRGYQKAYQTWKNFGLPQEDTTEFVYAWSSVGRKVPNGVHAPRCFSGDFLKAYQAVCGLLGNEATEQRYPALFAYYRAGDQATREEVRDFYQTDHVIIENDKKPTIDAMSYSERLYYKIFMANSMARSSGQQFDLIIRVRPDYNIKMFGEIDWQKVIYESRRENMVFTCLPNTIYKAGGNGMDDMIAIGVPEVMNIYSDCWLYAKAAISRQLYTGFFPQYDGHSTLYWTCLYQGIRARQMTELHDQKAGFIYEGLEDVSRLTNAEIRALLQIDAARRMDDIDHKLLAAL